MSVNILGQSLNPTLTTYAKGLAQDRASALANWIAPDVPVVMPTGKFRSFSDKNMFQAIDTALSNDGEPNRVEFGATDGTYNCAAQALEIRINKQEMDMMAAGGDPLLLRQNKIGTLVSSAVVSHEKAVWDYVKANTTAVAAVGNWSSANVDPITEIDAQIATIVADTGIMPNAMAISISAWNIMRNNPNVLKRKVYGTAPIGATLELIASYCLNPAMQIKIGTMAYDTRKPNNADTSVKANVIGSECFLFIRSDAPSVYDPTAFKVFRTATGGVEAVYSYTAPNQLFEGHIVYWTRDIQKTSAYSVKRITVS
jgi:hypothetical protein